MTRNLRQANVVNVSLWVYLLQHLFGELLVLVKLLWRVTYSACFEEGLTLIYWLTVPLVVLLQVSQATVIL